MREARVLEIIGKRPVGGVGTVMLNYQRHMNMERVQMDYLIFGEQEETFDKEVKKLGSRVYTYPALSGRQMGQTKKYFEQFFQNITENMILFISMHPILLFYVCRLLQSMESVIELYIAMQLYMRRVKEKRCGIECFGVYLKSTLPIGSDARRQQERSFLAKKIILC